MTKPTWKRRQDRAAILSADHPHADELLAFYGHVLEIQEPLYRKAKRSSWFEGVNVTGDVDGPRLRLERFSGRERARLFRRFVEDVGSVSTEVLASIGTRLSAADSPATDVLEAFLFRQPLDTVAEAFDCKPLPLEFFPRAFMQPVTEALVEKARIPGSVSAPRAEKDAEMVSSPTCCQNCGWPPQLGLLRDEVEIKGRRLLVCSLCSSEWVFPRSTCPSCGETRADRLQYHVTDFWPHIRIEECGICHTYIKAVDLRVDGRAVPVVDELASVELDLWADEKGFEKLQRNLLGL